MSREIIKTDAAPQAIGPYSQAIKTGNTVYISGQIPLDPGTGEMACDDLPGQARQAFSNLQAIAEAAGGSLDDAVKINISLVNLAEFPQVNAVMETFFNTPYPARACVEVSALPKGALIEIEAILAVG